MPRVPLNELNFNDLYVYNLADFILNPNENDVNSSSTLSPLFFNVDAELVKAPQDYNFGKHEDDEKSVFDFQDLNDSIPMGATTPKIVYPTARPSTLNKTTDGDQDSKSSSDDEEYSEDENESDIYKRDERSATYSTQYSPPSSTVYKDTRVSFLNNARSAYIYLNSSVFPVNPESVDPNKQHLLDCLGVLKAVFDSSNGEVNDPVGTLKKWKLRSMIIAENRKKIKEKIKEKDNVDNQKNGFEEIEDDISAIFMIGGGHFAAAIISHTPKLIKKVIHKKEAESILPQTVNLIAQKSVHRYTTRRKQGGSQSAMDNAKGKANSAGSTLRRYNEQMLAKDVKETIQQWSEYLQKCKSIFIKANTVGNFKLIVAGEDYKQKNSKEFMLYKNDSRIKRIPVNSKKITITELKYVWVDLTYLSIIKLPRVDTKSKLLKEREELLANSKQTNKKKQISNFEEDSLETRQSNDIIQLLKKQRAPALMSYLRKQNISASDFRFQPAEKFQKWPTLLHFASDHNLAHMVYILLNNLKVDSTIQNKFNETPFDLLKKHITIIDNDAENTAFKGTMRSYQKARYNLGEQFCDWESSAHVIVPPLSDSQIKDLEEQESNKEKEELQKVVKQELQIIKDDEELKLKQKNATGKRLENSANGSLTSQIIKSLGDEDRKRFEREQRARAAEARLKKMSGK